MLRRSTTPARLPKGRDYFELRDGLVNCQRKFTIEKAGRVVFLGGSITAGGAWRQHTCDYLTWEAPASLTAERSYITP